jgi:hypothetical protein
MKNLPVILLTIIVTTAVSCKKEMQPVTNPSVSTDSQKVIIASNAWKVSSFIENGVNQSPDFSTYIFQFNSDGSAVANSTGIGILYYGRWSMLQSSHSLPDDSGNHTGMNDSNKLIIALSGNYHMDEISESWRIIKLTASEMWLTDDNPASPKEIHFIMN